MAGSRSGRAPLIGRGRELGTLLALWKACQSGQGAVALVRAVEGDLTDPGRGLLGLPEAAC